MEGEQLDISFEELEGEELEFKWFDIPSLIIFWLLLGIVALQFITRYVFNSSFGWTEEIARYFLILLGFIGAISCVKRNKHIFLEFFYRYLPKPYIKPMIIITEVIVCGFFTLAGFLCIELAESTTQNMASVDLPKSVIYYVVVLACFSVAVFSLVNIYQYFRLPHEALYIKKFGSLN